MSSRQREDQNPQEKSPEITVRILDHTGKETFRYPGRLIEKDGSCILLEGFFNREDTPVDRLVLKRGDRFSETFYTDRWYNILEVHDRQDDRLMGWYCNICYPAEYQPGSLSYRDLDLDLLVYPDGRQVLLDEEEYKQLPLPPEIRKQGNAALAELKGYFQEKLSR